MGLFSVVFRGDSARSPGGLAFGKPAKTIYIGDKPPGNRNSWKKSTDKNGLTKWTKK